MTTVSMGVVAGLPSRQKKAWPQSPPFPSQKTAIILLKSLHRVCRGGLWQEISIWNGGDLESG